MYSSGDTLLLAALLLFVRSSRIHNNNVRLYGSRRENSLFTERPPEKSQSSGSAVVQRSTLELIVIQIQIHEDYDAKNHLHFFVLLLLELTAHGGFVLNTNQQMQSVLKKHISQPLIAYWSIL